MKNTNTTTKATQTTNATTKATKTTHNKSLSSILTTIFVALKLSGHITWSWVWVLSPLWIPLVIAIVVIVITAVVFKKVNK